MKTISLTGIVPPSLDKHSIYWNCEGEETASITLSASATSKVWFRTQLQGTSSTTRNATLSNLPPGISLDFAVVGPSHSEGMVGRQVIVDDASPNLMFKGNWDPIKGEHAYGGTVHSSTNIGDSVSISFIGKVKVAHSQTGVLTFASLRILCFSIRNQAPPGIDHRVLRHRRKLSYRSSPRCQHNPATLIQHHNIQPPFLSVSRSPSDQCPAHSDCYDHRIDQQSAISGRLLHLHSRFQEFRPGDEDQCT